ncbi:VanZ family protein [Oscillatoria salina]|uniref:VanZ family protein n=1 Tax=Oscillatoria salina TaxID=331517 RepID=UPI001CCB82E1|nr:VanZ family protein [Oscillatoria salina]
MKQHNSKLVNDNWTYRKVGVAIASFIYGMILLSIFVAAYTGNLPAQLNDIPYHDTLGHLILYGIATYLGQCLLQHRHKIIFGCKIPLWPLMFGIFTVVEEFVQSFSPNRTFSWLDLTASLVGILCGYWLAKQSR